MEIKAPATTAFMKVAPGCLKIWSIKLTQNTPLFFFRPLFMLLAPSSAMPAGN
ncbi:hypothetical protein CCACVL1_22545 [Corchorus capsularis]|uniref:Uncharacterized protein n=1 Tax=Corchorus capsularis TaxID=210143 RepID=A0A1R3GXY6_COCAP|nr:hypothetical protein CCACVL1_22545 [Corchorus capsularis]